MENSTSIFAWKCPNCDFSSTDHLLCCQHEILGCRISKIVNDRDKLISEIQKREHIIREMERFNIYGVDPDYIKQINLAIKNLQSELDQLKNELPRA